MIQIEFNYNCNIIMIQAKMDDIFQEVINKYIQKSLFDPKTIYFIANGIRIIPEQTVQSQMSPFDKESKSLKVLVQTIEEINPIEEVIVNSNYIICPKCFEPCRIKAENFKITLFDCINNHINNNIKIKDFPNTQKINISKVICDKCKFKNKGNCPNGEFYKCLTCNKNLCLICKPNHESNHKIILYDKKNYICQKNNEHLIKYCTQCNKNLCYSCDDEHDSHNTISFKNIKPDLEKTKNYLLEIKNDIKIFNQDIKEIINILNIVMDSINIYYELNNTILNNYQIENRNYQILQNIKQISFNNEIFESVKYISKLPDIKNKLFNIIDLYNDINYDNNQIKLLKKGSFKEKLKNENIIEQDYSSFDNLNQMTIVYDIKNNINEITLFNKNFVENNKKNCYLLIDEKENELIEKYKRKNIK